MNCGAQGTASRASTSHQKHRQRADDHAPDLIVVDQVISMNEDVAECNDAIGISDLRRNSGVALAYTIDRFSDDLEITLNACRRSRSAL